MNIMLRGNSGCDISVIENSGRLIVKKTSRDERYNDRLYRQYVKQKGFTSSVFSPAETYGFALEDGRASFTMEYLNGMTMAEALRTLELSQVPGLGSVMMSVIPRDIRRCESANGAFRDKLASLEKDRRMDRFPVSNAFQQLRRFDWSWASGSPCHGDLTFENMILKDGHIYLIDFLDSFYDSWVIDVAKMLQDAELGWHYRYEGLLNNNLSIRLLCLKESMLAAISAHPMGRQIFETVYHTLLLNVLRIIPYCKDDVTKCWIDRQITYLTRILDETKERVL